MSRYTYLCIKCNIYFDIDKPMAECSKDEFCPECKRQAERVYTPPPIIYKGVGWHNSDYSKDYNKHEKANKRAKAISLNKKNEVR